MWDLTKMGINMYIYTFTLRFLHTSLIMVPQYWKILLAYDTQIYILVLDGDLTDYLLII